MPSLRGFGISNYRSIGSEAAKVGPLAKINLFIGRNNAGKSNLLRFAYEHLQQLLARGTAPNGHYKGFSAADRPYSGNSQRVLFLMPNPTSGNFPNDSARTAHEQLDTIISQPPFSNWIEADLAEKSINSISTNLLEAIKRQVSKLEDGGRNFHRGPGFPGDIDANLTAMLLGKFQSGFRAIMVPAKRTIGLTANADQAEETKFDGKDLVNRLANLQNPTPNPNDANFYNRERNRFNSICRLLQDITGDPEARIEVPGSRKSITTFFDGRTLDLESVGTGIHEAIVIAAVAAVNPGTLICLEEPEIHLHPILQRKLLDYLSKKTDNQYLIATHSVHLMDHAGAAIFRVELDDNKNSIITPVVTASEKFEMCSHLGIRPSDLLQTNCIIWVEGPSDRVYLNYWLKFLEPNLREGIEYSIMFYGGRLLSHLSAEEEVEDCLISDFIQLRRLNRSVAMLIDSDRTSASAPIRATKERLKADLSKNRRGFAWITEGREVENYLPQEQLKSAIKTAHPASELKISGKGRFAQIKVKSLKGVKPVGFDKVGVAEKFVSDNPQPDYGQLDLQARVEALINFIKQANQDG